MGHSRARKVGKAKRAQPVIRGSHERYAAKLLFQYRVMVDGKPNKKRTCEERVIVVTAQAADEALMKAKAYGKAEKLTYKNNDGNPVHFELVGILDLLHLGLECEDEEVWYDITERLEPMERRKKIIPPERKLNAIAQPTLGQRTSRRLRDKGSE